MKDIGELTGAGTQTVLPARQLRIWRLLRFARAVGVGALSGIAAGLIGGAGARVAMRISGALTGPECVRLVTENGNDCGVITGGGTAFLVIFGAMAFGAAGGVLYASLRPWLAGLGRRRGLVFGLALFAIAGTSIVDSGNDDFQRFGTPAVNVLVFFLLFPLFGLAVANFHDRVDRRFPNFPPPAGSPIGFFTTIAYIVVIAPAFIVPLGGVGLGGGRSVLIPFAVMAALALPPLAHRELRSGRNRRRAIALTILAAVPYAIGTVITAQSVLEILF